MGDLVNLRQVKKQRAKAAKAAKAEANRLRHGRTPAQKAADRAAEEKSRAALDQARLDGEKPSSR